MSSTRASLGTRVTAAFCAALLIPSNVVASALPHPQAATTTTASAAKIPNDQLDSLVAPIALYPDPLLAQVLAASTYPLEIVQLQQWMAKHPDLKGEALAAAVEKETWDPAVQGLAALPDVVKRLGDDIQWTTDVGNAFLAQQSDVMDAVQRMRKKASDAGNLKTTEQQKVTTQVVQTKEVIVIQQANPQVVYVPAYNPVVVYGPPIYPYPPIYYPPMGYYAAGVAIGFGVGIAMGAFWGGGWGYGPRWGYGSVNINVNNRYVNHYNRYNSVNRYGGSWNHNPAHRGGTRTRIATPRTAMAARRVATQWRRDRRRPGRVRVQRHGRNRRRAPTAPARLAAPGRIVPEHHPVRAVWARIAARRARATASAIAAFRAAQLPPTEAATPSAAPRAAARAAALPAAAASAGRPASARRAAADGGNRP